MRQIANGELYGGRHAPDDTGTRVFIHIVVPPNFPAYAMLTSYFEVSLVAGERARVLPKTTMLAAADSIVKCGTCGELPEVAPAM